MIHRRNTRFHVHGTVYIDGAKKSCYSMNFGNATTTMLRFSYAILTGLILHTCLTAQVPHTPSISDLQSLKTTGYMQLSPLGDELIYTLGGPVTGQLWSISTRTPTPPKLLATGSIPTWSPDGKSLAYYSSDSGSQQLWTIEIESGRAQQITNVDGGINPDPSTRVVGWIGDPLRFSWSPDGRKLVFGSRVEVTQGTSTVVDSAKARDVKSGTPLILTNKTPAAWTLSGIFANAFGPPALTPDPNKPAPLPRVMVSQLFVVDIATKSVQQLTSDASVYFNPAWSPDGHTIACASSDGRSPYTGPTNIYALDPSTGKKSALTTGTGDKRLPRWSPDGKRIAYTGGEHFGMQSVFVIPATGGDVINVGAKVDRYITEFEWLPDSKSLAMIDWDGTNWPVVRVSVADGSVENLTGSTAAMRQYLSVARDGAFVWGHNDGSSYGVILSQSRGGVAASVLVAMNPQIRTWELGAQEVVRWRNSRGDELEGILIKPVGFKAGQKYPLIVDGYPAQPNGFKSSLMMGNQIWASKGYAVFWPNARAPHMWMNAYRDQAFSQAGKGPEGWDVTVDDVLSGVDELVRRGIVDSDRMGLQGFSNGGGVVNYLITRTNRFKCAVSVAGVYPDWLLPTFLHTDATIPTFEGGTSPWDDPAAYVKLSAVFHLRAVTTPMLLADGDNDGDFLLGTIELYNSLRALGKDVIFLRYPGMGHGFSGPALQDFWERENAFLDQYLKPTPNIK
jgi:dipeptidyl aminopeptidase/acylaminoacyl peptidase